MDPSRNFARADAWINLLSAEQIAFSLTKL